MYNLEDSKIGRAERAELSSGCHKAGVIGMCRMPLKNFSLENDEKTARLSGYNFFKIVRMILKEKGENKCLI